jgi:hypothetical protein
MKITEAAKTVPVIAQADLCVIGGSCTGVCAAVRAARLGLKVIIVEAQSCFGGVATNAMVNIWHSLRDTDCQEQIIAGLTEEIIQLLQQRNAVEEKMSRGQEYYVLNTEELKIELDQLVLQHDITPMLHTRFVEAYVNPQNGELEGIFVENKDGRGAILAKTFIDASGDGDLAARLGLETRFSAHLQPGTTCAKISNIDEVSYFEQLYRDQREAYQLPETFIWHSQVPGEERLFMLAASRVSFDMSKAQQLAQGEIEGRRQVRAIMDMIRAAQPEVKINLVQLPSCIGVRETRHVNCHHRILGTQLMSGERYPDAIANGTYPSDVHHAGRSGITFRYLDGRESLARPGHPNEERRWREPLEAEPRFYQIPYRSMLPAHSPYPNLIVAGRMIDADEMAHGAVRVMVNLNQVGEAAGVAAYLALHQGCGFEQVAAQELRRELKKGGSAVV